MEEGDEVPLEDHSHSEKEGGASDREGSVEGDLSSSPCSESKFLSCAVPQLAGVVGVQLSSAASQRGQWSGMKGVVVQQHL